ITFLAPKFPTNIARHIFGIEFQPIQNEARRLHNIVPNSVTRHPRNFVFSHKRATLAAQIPARNSCVPCENYVFARRRDATSLSAPPTTINSCAAGLSGGKGNDFPSTVRIDLALVDRQLNGNTEHHHGESPLIERFTLCCQ